LSSFASKLFQVNKPVSAAPFIVLRMVFGALMFLGTIRFLALGWVDDHYLRPIFHFHYFGFSWIEPLPAFWLYAVHFLMLLASLVFISGYYFRISALVLFLSFTYTELIDLTYYLNHYYFVSLACLLFCLAPNISKSEKYRSFGEIPAWGIWMFKGLLALVYFNAGIAKINGTWLLDALPLKIWLPAQDKLPFIGPLLAHDFTPYFFSWAGMLYDCSIVVFLAWKPTRLLAYFGVIFFHVLTGWMFQIGVFPAVMIGATLIFFSPNWHEKLLHFLKPILRKAVVEFNLITSYLNQTSYKFTLSFIGIFFILQILFPWRHLLYPGNLFWTEEGYRFSWRVMLMEKAGTAQFYVKDGKTGREGLVENREFLNAHQEKQMAMQPDMILQFAHFLGKHYAGKGIQNPKVRAEVYVTLNGKPSQLLIDDQIDLMTIEDSWAPKTWIKPYEY
jgi:hypothetical protein